jgi:hypothetical protein
MLRSLPRPALWAFVLFSLAACGSEDDIVCTCSGPDVAYQADADPDGLASEATCASGFQTDDARDAGASIAASETYATAACCAPGATDCACSCAISL